MYGIPSLTLLDLATGVRQDIGAGLRKGAGMLDLTWIDDTKLLSCGYDSYARLWDMRSGTCVRKWEEPFNEAIYCMSTDNNMTLVSTPLIMARVRYLYILIHFTFFTGMWYSETWSGPTLGHETHSTCANVLCQASPLRSIQSCLQRCF